MEHEKHTDAKESSVEKNKDVSEMSIHERLEDLEARFVALEKLFTDKKDKR